MDDDYKKKDALDKLFDLIVVCVGCFVILNVALFILSGELFRLAFS